MSDNQAPKSGEESKTEAAKPAEKVEKTFTQAELDRIVQDRLDRQAKTQFGDYEDLKAKAGQSKSLEDRIADMETRASKAEHDALRSRIAAEHGISTKRGDKGEPSDADLFLTGTDEATLKSQALRLASRVSEQKKQGNFAPNEGKPTVNVGGEDAELRQFTNSLFNKE